MRQERIRELERQLASKPSAETTSRRVRFPGLQALRFVGSLKEGGSEVSPLSKPPTVPQGFVFASEARLAAKKIKSEVEKELESARQDGGNSSRSASPPSPRASPNVGGSSSSKAAAPPGWPSR